MYHSRARLGALASALAVQGYRARFVEGPGVHDDTAWRDMLDPHLTALLQDVWAR